MLLPLLTMTEKGVYAISNMSTLSMGAYDRYRLDANNRVRTDAELVEYVEDRVRKQLNTSATIMISGTRF